MADQPGGTIHGTAPGGVAGSHSQTARPQILAGPSTDNQFNAFRARIIPVACWKVDDIRFEFDCSFVRPETAQEFIILSNLLKLHPNCPLSVFGHADPVGTDAYNKVLSGRRASAVYAVLISNTDPGRAVSLWTKLSTEENWKYSVFQTMQTATNLPTGTQNSVLIKTYLQKLCGSDLKLAATNFLAQGADSGGKGDYQGCGEFNPVLLFSQKEESDFAQASDKRPRNLANASNRRVMVLIFKRGSRVLPAKWPCPPATGDTSGCIKRFWSDGDARRSKHLPDEQRLFEFSHDTFACRFYQRLIVLSPCERQTRYFRFGFSERLVEKQLGDIRLRIESTDGSDVRTIAMDKGVVVGSLRYFDFSDAKPGLDYRASLIYKDRRLLLLMDADVTEIMDPADPDKSITHVHAKDAPASSSENQTQQS